MSSERNRPISPARRMRRRLPRTSLAVAISAALGASTSWAQVTGVVGGPTTVTPGGGAAPGYTSGVDVTTNLTRGAVGLNRFEQFNVGADTHVRLNLPGGTDSLVNVVEGGARAEVFGLVQGILDGSGAVGGHLYFASPDGFLVGGDGVIEAGALTITTPTSDFVGDFVGEFSGGGPLGAATQAMLAGNVPLGETGVIEIQGRLEARDSVLLYSRGVSIARDPNDGTSADPAVVVTDGAGATAGQSLFQSLVSTNGLLEGTALAETDGGALVIVAGSGGATIGADALVDAGDGGLLVTAADFQRPSVDAIAIEDWFRPSRTADASITIDGELRGAGVTVVAAAEAVTEWQTPSLPSLDDLAPELQQLMDDAKGALTQSLPALDGAVAIANADARVIIGDSARIESAGDVTLEAHAVRSATAEASAEDGAWLGAAAAYGRLSGETRVEVADGAAVIAPAGALTLRAFSENTLSVSAEASANQDTSVSLSGTVAVSEVDVSTVAELHGGTDGGGNVVVDADRAEVVASSENSYSTGSTSAAAGGAAIGLAVAVSLIESETRATVGGALELGGGLSVLASSSTSALNVSAATEAGDGGDNGGADGEDALGGWITPLLGDASDDVAADNQGAGGEPGDSPAAGGDGGLPLKFGSAVAFLEIAETSKAEVLDDAVIGIPAPDPDTPTSAGDVAILARRELEGFTQQATSATASEGDQNGTSVSVSAGLALGFVEHGATASVGDGVTIIADRFGVASEVTVAPNTEWGVDDGFTGIGDFQGDGADTDSLTSYASATLDGSDTVAVSGAVSYLDLTSRAETLIGDRVTIDTLEASPWTTTFDGEDYDWSAALALGATADVRTVELAGNATGSGSVGIGGGVAWSERETVAAVRVGQDGELAAVGDIAIGAARRDDLIVLTPVAGTGAGADSVASLNAAVAYGRLRGTTDARIGYGSAISGGGDVTLTADTVVAGEVETVSTLEQGGTFALAGTVAYADFDHSTHAGRASDYDDGYTPLPGAETRLESGSLTVRATQSADYSVAATAAAESRVAVGIAAAVADITSDVHAGLAGVVETDGDVVVLADSLTGTKSVGAETRAAAPAPGEEEGEGETEVPGDVATDGTSATGFAQRRGDAADEQVSGDVNASSEGSPATPGGSGGNPGGGAAAKNFDLRLSGAAAILLGEESARATLAAGTSIGDAADRADDVVVLARREEAGLVMRAKSATEAKLTDNGTGIAVGAALSFVDLDNEAAALVGDGAAIHAQRIGIGSAIALPDHLRLPNLDDLPDFTGHDDLAAFGEAALDQGEAYLESWFTTYVSASAASRNSTVDFAGAVNYLDLATQSEAWVGDNVTLDAAGTAGEWDYVLVAEDVGAGIGEDAWTFDDTVSVVAVSDVSTLDLAGNLSGLTGFGVDATGTTAAIGGAFAWSERSHRTVAGIGAGSDVTADDGSVGVNADARDRAITLAPTSGRGADYTVNGTAAVTRTDHHTVAGVHAAADVTAGNFDVLANQALTVWSVAGAVSLGQNLGLGLGSAVNDLATRTLASLGDNSADRPEALGAAGSAGGPGEIRVDVLNIDAATRGTVGAAAVAGARAGGSTPGGGTPGGGDPGGNPGDGTADTGSNTARSGFDTRTSTVQSDADGFSADDSLEGPSNDLASGQTNGTQGVGGSGTTRSGASFRIAGSGSAAVNLTELGTEASIDGADVAGRNGGEVTVHVRALNDTDLLALAGAGALVSPGGSGGGGGGGGGGSGGFTAAIAGAVAINQLGNVTRAAITDSLIDNAGDSGAGGAGVSGVAVEAMTAGELIGVGLGLAANTAGGNNGLAAAGSVSLGMLRNDTLAEIADSTVRGANGTADAHVVAYDRSRIATGGGALTYGGRYGLGVAITYADIENETRAAVTGSTIESFNALDVGAFSASRILSAAAGLQLSTDSNQGVGIAGSVTVNRIRNKVTAQIGGNNGATVNVAGDVTVQAASVAGDEFDALLANLDAEAAGSSPHAVNWSGENSEIDGSVAHEGTGAPAGTHERQGDIDAEYAEFTAGATTGGLLEGEAIVGIAGNIQASVAQSAIGLSFSGNFIDNVYEAEIDNATVVADAVTVDAVQSARILGVAVGAAVTNGKFAGLGSGVANVIGLDDDAGHVHAGVRGATVDANTITVRGHNRSRIDAAAGNASYSSRASFGAAIGYNEIATATTASVADSTVRGALGAGSTADALTVEALATGDIYALAAAGSASNQLALAGSANINRLNQTVGAAIDTSTLSVADVDVRAGSEGLGDAAEVWALTGALTLGGQTAFGAAFAWNEIGNDYSAEVLRSNFTSLDTLDIDAASAGAIRTLTGAGALSSGSLAITGAGSYAVIESTTTARLADTSIADTGALVALDASDDADIVSVAASLAVSTGSSAGAGAVAVSDVRAGVTAEVLGGAAAPRLDVGTLLVDAESASSLTTVGAGIAGSANAGLAGSAAVNTVGTTVTARIADGAIVAADGDVRVGAHSRDEVQLVAGSLGVGLSALGASATVAVNMLEGTTAALIEGATTRVTALGGGGVGIGSGVLGAQRGLVNYAAPGGGQANSSGNEAALSADYTAAALSEGTELARGVAVNASSLQSVGSYIATAGINPNVKSGAALAGAVSVNLLERETTAAVRDATVDVIDGTGAVGADLTVRASAQAESRSLVIGAALSSVGAAGAVASDVFDRTTTAEIVDANINVLGDVTVDAVTTQTANAMAFGAAGGTWVGVAAGGVLMLMDGDNTARVSGGSVEADNLLVNAEQRNVLNLTTANAAVGSVAGAGSFAVGVVESTNTAEVSNAALTIDNTVEIDAQTWNELHTIAASGAAGGTSIAGMASVSIIGSETYATLANSTVDAGDASGTTEASSLVRIAAEDSLATRSYGGGVSLGYGNALGASATVVVGQATVGAASIDSTVTADRMEVDADRYADVEAYTLTAAVGGGMSIGAGVGVVLLGGSGVAGVDTVDDPEANNQRSVSSELDNENGSTLDQLDAFGGGQLVEGDDPEANQFGEIGLSADRKARVTAKTQYGAGSTVRNGGEHETRATVSGGTLRVGALDVEANEGNRTINAGGALAGGIAGIGGAAAITHVASVVRASVDSDVTLTGVGGLSVDAGSGATSELIGVEFDLNDYAGAIDEGIDADRTVLVLAAAGGAGIVGVGAAYADGRAASTVTAGVGGVVTRDVGVTAPINVTASDRNSIGAYGIGAALGAAAAGLVVGYADKASVVEAEVLADAALTGAGALALDAQAGGGVTARGAAASGGLLVAGSGSIIIAKDDVTARSVIRRDAQITDAGTITITADANPRTSVKAFAGSLGSVAIGVSYAEANASAKAEAQIEDDVVIDGAVTDVVLSATTAPATGYAAEAQATAAGGGWLLSANGAVARANDLTRASATVGNRVTFSSGGDVTAESHARPAASADGVGYSGAGVGAFGVAIAESHAGAVARSHFGDDVTIAGAADVVIDARVTPGAAYTARAVSTTGAGAGLVGAVGASAVARTTTVVEAATGSDLVLPAGRLRIDAFNQTNQFARGTGRAGAAIAVGVVDVHAESDTTTVASLGHSARAFGDRAGDIIVRARGVNADRADAVSGTGGVIAGSAAKTTTTSTGSTFAEIARCGTDCPVGQDRVTLRAGRVSVEAAQDTTFYGSVNSRSAHLAGYSGARAEHSADSNATARVGERASLDLLHLNLDAKTKTVQPASGNNIDVGAGGALNASAGRADSVISGNARVEIGADADVRSSRFGNTAGEGDIRMRAFNEVDAYQYGRLDTGGVIDIPKVDIVGTVNLTGVIEVAQGATVGAAQDLVAVAYSRGDVEARASVRTHGLAGAASGTTRATLNATHHIHVRPGATLAANRDAFIASGLDAGRGVGTLSAIADTYIWNKTAFPIKTDPTADARLVGANYITVHDGGSVIAGRDAQMMTTWQEYHARGVGIGKDLWREVAEQVTNTVVKILTFGKVKKAVSLEIRRGTSQVADNDRITVDGEVIGGAAAYQYLWIKDELDADGNPVVESSLGVNYTITERDIMRDLEEQLFYYEALMEQYAASGSALFWRAYAQAYTLQEQMQALNALRDENGDPLDEFLVKAIELERIETRGGNVLFDTGTLSGSGRVSLGDVPDWNAVPNAPVGALTPGSSLSVRLVNESDAHLYVNDIEMGDSVGSIVLRTRLGGAALLGGRYQYTVDLSNRSNWEGIAVSGGASGGAPEVHIVNTWQGPPQPDETAPTPSFLPPDIQLLGNISNRHGLVSVGNTTGSIISSGNIEADTVRIAAGGRYVQNFTTGFTHVGGVPDGSTPPSESEIVAGGAVYISGEYVNINGLVRSGVADYSLTLDQATLDNLIAQAPADENEIYLSGQYDDGAPNLNELRAYYDRERDVIVVRKAEVKPGYVFIFGDVVSTGSGRIEAVSGYGTIDLVNNTNKALVLEGLDVGTGGNGRVEIVDMGYANVPTDLDPNDLDGEVVAIPSPRRTVYEHDWLTNTLNVTQSYLNAVLFDDANGQTLDVIDQPIGAFSLSGTRATQYQPQTGRYWVRENILEPLTFRFFGITVPLPGFSVLGQQETLHSGLPSGPGVLATRSASVPIDIVFDGASEGFLRVQSASDVRLSGELRNLHGTVRVDTDGGVYNPGVLAGLVGRRIEVDARTGIGTDIAPLQLEVGDGAARVVTARNDVHLRGRGTDLLLDHVRSDRGDLYVYSQHDIIDSGLHADAALTGRSITLESIGGSLGSADQLLRIETGHTTEDALVDLSNLWDFDWLFGGLRALGFRIVLPGVPEPAADMPVAATLSAAAQSGAYIEETAGDLHVNLVDVMDGDVLLRVRHGSLVNALGRGALDLDRVEQLSTLWQDMRLTGADAEAAAAEAVEGYQQAIVTQYHEYWQLRGFLEADATTQSRLENVFSTRYLDPSYRDVLASRLGDAGDASALLDSLTGATDLDTIRLRTAYELGVLEEHLATELGVDELAGAAGFDQHDEAWAFTLAADDPRVAAITAGAEWTEEELVNSINAEALIDTDSTLFELVSPNIHGNNVTVETSASVGSFDEPIRIELPGDDADPNAYPALTDEQIAALLAAQPGDITFEGGTFNEVTGEFEGDITAIIIGRTLVVGVDVGDASGDGGLTVDAGEDAFVVSPYRSLRVDRVTAPGDVRIQVRGDLLAAANGMPAIVGASQGLLLEAAGGQIGRADEPFYVNLSDAPFVTARAANGIHLVSQAGDLLIDRMNTLSGTLFLRAEDGSIVARDDDLEDLVADVIHVEASGDIGGGSGASGFDGLNVRHAGDGYVTGHAGGAFRVATLDGDLALRDVGAGDGLAALSLGTLSAETITAGGDLAAESIDGSLAIERASAGGDVMLRAGGNLAASRIDAGGALDGESVNGAATLESLASAGDMAVVAATAIDASALIAGGGLNLESRHGGLRIDEATSAAGMTLTAEGDLSAAALIAGADLDARSTAGTLAARDAVADGDLSLTAQQLLTGVDLDAAGNLHATSTAGALSLLRITGGDDVVATARYAVNAEDIAAGGTFDAESRSGALSLTHAVTGGDVTLSARDALQVHDVVTRGGLSASSHEGAAVFDSVFADGAVAASAAGELTARMVSAGTTLGATSAEAALRLQQVTSGGAMMARAFDTLTASQVTAGGPLYLESESSDVLLERVTGLAPGDGAVEVMAGGGIFGTALAGGAAASAHLAPPVPGSDFHIAGRGESAAVRLHAGGDIGRVGEPLVIVAPVLDAFSVNGSMRLVALETVLGGRVDVSHGGLSLYSYGDIGTRDRLDVRVRDDLDLRANNIRADVVHTAAAGALPVTLQRIDGRELESAELWIDAPNGLAVARMHGHEFLIETSASDLGVADGRVLESFEYGTPDARVYMNNAGDSRRAGVDVQLYQPGYDFFLTQDGRFTYTNAYVLAYGPGYQVRVPNYVPDHRLAERDVDGRAGERQSGAWVSDDSDGTRWSFETATPPLAPEIPVELSGLALATPDDLYALEGGGFIRAAFGETLLDREAVAERERRAAAVAELVRELDTRTVRFEFDSASVGAEDVAFLDRIATVLAEQPDRRVRITGYTDGLGELRYNRRLSEERAAAVADYLTARGVRAAQMELVAGGPGNAIASNETEEGREANRRVEIELLR